MNLSDLVNEYKRAGYDKYRLSGGQLIDEGGQVMMNATPEDIERYKEYQHAQFAAGNEPEPVARAAPRPMATGQLRLADLMRDNSEAGVSFAQPDPYENEARRLANYGGHQPQAMPAPQDPANVRLSKMMSGGTTGGWSNQNGRRTLTMQGGPRVEPPSPQKLVEQQFQQEAMRALQDPAIPMAQKIQVYQAMNKGQDLDSVMKSLQVQKLQKEISQPIPGEKPPAGYRFTAEGLEAIPGGPADLKTQAINAQKLAGATDVDSAVATLRDAYNRLEQGGGITSTNNSTRQNIGAAVGSSEFGQSVGKYLGTKNQSARNDIAMTRPALLAALMKATGMSAKQMDSNAELKLWMATATDPSLDVESNRRALAAIERKYLGSPNTQAGAPNQPGAPREIRSEAEAANLPKGTIVIINGRRAVVE